MLFSARCSIFYTHWISHTDSSTTLVPFHPHYHLFSIHHLCGSLSLVIVSHLLTSRFNWPFCLFLCLFQIKPTDLITLTASKMLLFPCSVFSLSRQCFSDSVCFHYIFTWCDYLHPISIYICPYTAFSTSLRAPPWLTTNTHTQPFCDRLWNGGRGLHVAHQSVHHVCHKAEMHWRCFDSPNERQDPTFRQIMNGNIQNQTPPTHTHRINHMVLP